MLQNVWLRRRCDEKRVSYLSSGSYYFLKHFFTKPSTHAHCRWQPKKEHKIFTFDFRRFFQYKFLCADDEQLFQSARLYMYMYKFTETLKKETKTLTTICKFYIYIFHFYLTIKHFYCEKHRQTLNVISWRTYCFRLVFSTLSLNNHTLSLLYKRGSPRARLLDTEATGKLLIDFLLWSTHLTDQPKSPRVFFQMHT